MNINRIIKVFLLLNTCFLASKCKKIENCDIWNKVFKCFRVSGNNTYCYVTNPNNGTTFCCGDTLNFNNFEKNNFENCISYSIEDHNKFLQKLFVLSSVLLICIVIGMVICEAREENGGILCTRRSLALQEPTHRHGIPPSVRLSRSTAPTYQLDLPPSIRHARSAEITHQLDLPSSVRNAISAESSTYQLNIPPYVRYEQSDLNFFTRTHQSNPMPELNGQTRHLLTGRPAIVEYLPSHISGIWSEIRSNIQSEISPKIQSGIRPTRV